MRLTHPYERAFETYLRARRIPYVAVHEARRALLPPPTSPASSTPDAIKSFDFLVYGRNTNLLVDVKGRRVPPAAGTPRRTPARLQTWVSAEDVEALRHWQQLFGPGFGAALVFVYSFGPQQPPDACFAEVLEHGGVWYALRVALLEEYAAAMKPRSPRWRTVDVPAREFERIGRPFAPEGFEPSPSARPALQPLPANAAILRPDPNPAPA
ncbi:MAG: HYExAFE family protein [Phycisphaerales bacterium]